MVAAASGPLLWLKKTLLFAARNTPMKNRSLQESVVTMDFSRLYGNGASADDPERSAGSGTLAGLIEDNRQIPGLLAA